MPSPFFLPRFIEARESEDGVWPLVKKPSVTWFKDASCIPVPLPAPPAGHSPLPSLLGCSMFRGPTCSSIPPASLFQLWLLLVPLRYLHPPWLGEHQSAWLSPLVRSHLASPTVPQPATGEPQPLLRGFQKENPLVPSPPGLSAQPFPVLIHSKSLHSSCVKNLERVYLQPALPRQHDC